MHYVTNYQSFVLLKRDVEDTCNNLDFRDFETMQYAAKPLYISLRIYHFTC